MSAAPTEDITALLDTLRKEKNGSKAFEILRIISYFEPWDIHMKMFLNLTDSEDNLEIIFGLLKKYSIVTSGSNKTVININCSVQKAIRTFEKCNEEEILEKALKMLEPDVNGNVNNMISVWGYASAFPKLVKKFLNIPYDIMVQLIDNVRYNDANIFGWKAVDLLKRTVDSDHPVLLNLLFSVGTVLGHEGKYMEALDILLPLYEKCEYLSEEREMIKPFMNMLKSYSNIVSDFCENSEESVQKLMKCILLTIGKQLHEMSRYGEALPIYQKLLRNEDVLETQDNMILIAFHDYALVLNYLGKYKESLAILKDIFNRRSELGIEGEGLLSVKCSMSTVLLKQSKFSEAYKMLCDVFEERKVSLGENHINTLRTKRDIAFTLNNLGKHDQALAMHGGLAENMEKVLGKDHIDILFTLINFAAIFRDKGEYQKALVIFVKNHKKLSENIGPNNVRTLNAKYNIAYSLFRLKKIDEALEYYQEIFDAYDQLFGSNHPDTKNVKREIVATNKIKLLVCVAAGDGNVDFVKDMIKNGFSINFKDNDGKTPLHHSAENGNFSAVQFFLENGAIYNSRDKNDKTPSQIAKNAKARSLLNSVTQLFKFVKLGEYEQLVNLIAERKNVINVKSEDGSNLLHWAAHNGHANIVQLLLANGAGIAEITHKGNTSLHIATSKNNKGVIEVLLQYGNHKYKNDFVNAQTTLGGTTALHIASKNGSLEVVKMLLKYGAAYNIEDSEDKIPSAISTNQDVTNLLTMIKDLFAGTKKGNFEVIKIVSESKFDAAYILNTCNDQGNSLLDVAKMNNPELAKRYLNLMKSLA